MTDWNMSEKLQLTPFIGLDESGKSAVFVSPFRLHKLSPMHMRGRPFPSHDAERDPMATLKAISDYYKESKKRKTK